MFSWSKQGGSSYPGTKRVTGATSSALAGGLSFQPNAAIARPIQGTVRPPDYTREQHLESYLGDDTLKRSTRRISTDDTTYDTVFQTILQDTLILRVHVPRQSNGSSSFMTTPGMTLAGVRARHPWVDPRMRIIGYHPITTEEIWKKKGMLLGTAIHEVVKHLQLNPPEVIEITDSGLRVIQPKKPKPSPPPQSTSQSKNNNHHQQQQNAKSADDGDDAPPNYDAMVMNVPGVKLPPIPKAYDSLDDMSRDDFDKLLNDKLEFLTFANNLPFVQEVLEIRCKLLDENKEHAESNLKKGEKLKILHEEVITLKKEYTSSLSKYQELEKKQGVFIEPPPMKTVLKELTKVKKASYSRSEKMAEEWLDNDDDSDDKGGGNDPDSFVARFVKERMIQHLSAAKIELLQSAPRYGKH